MSETGKPPPKESPPLPPRPFPSNGSPSALREDHRLIRSEIQNMRRSPRHPWQESKESKLDLNSWNRLPSTILAIISFLSFCNSFSLTASVINTHLFSYFQVDRQFSLLVY